MKRRKSKNMQERKISEKLFITEPKFSASIRADEIKVGENKLQITCTGTTCSCLCSQSPSWDNFYII